MSDPSPVPPSSLTSCVAGEEISWDGRPYVVPNVGTAATLHWDGPGASGSTIVETHTDGLVTVDGEAVCMVAAG